MWRHLVLSYTFLSLGEGNARLWVADLSRGEGNAKLWVAENQRRENLRKSPTIPGIPQSFLSCFIKKNAWYLHAVWCQYDFRMGFSLCEFDGCKTAKMRVGAHLGPMLEILMVNLPWNFDILCMKEVTTGFWVNSRWCKILNISFFAIRYIKLYSKIISSIRP